MSMNLYKCFWSVAAFLYFPILQQADDAAGQFTVARPTCPDAVSTFSCTVDGDNTSVTTWRVGGNSICLLVHLNAVATATCGPGSVFIATSRTGFGTSATSFSSTLSVTATPALNGTLVECFGPGSIGVLGNRVGGSMIHVLGPPSVPSLSCVDLSDDTNGTVAVTVSWTLSGGDSADFYLINITTNDPQPPYGGLVIITTASVTQHELTGFQTGYEYNITVRGVNCGSQEGNESEPQTITPQVPTVPPMPTVYAEYDRFGTLQTIESTWNEVVPVTVSVDCAIGQNIRASYELSYTSSSGVFNTTCVVNGIDCNNGVCRHELQNNIADNRCQPPLSQFNSESVTVTVVSRNIVGRSNSTTLMTPVPKVCAEYDRTTGTLQRIGTTWNGMDMSYELSYTSSSGTSITTCVVDGTDCSDGVCHHELQDNTTDSRCQPPAPQFNSESVTVTVTARSIVGISSVSRNVSGMNTLGVNVDSMNTENAFVECTFEPGYTCTIDYGTDSSYSNLVYRDNSTTVGQNTTISLSQDLERGTTYYFSVSAESSSICERVRGIFRIDCTVSDLGITAAQGGMVDPRCDGQFGSSLPICNGVVCYNRATAMSESIYICDDNFYLMGNATRVCQNDGNWNGSIPHCILSPDTTLSTGATVGITAVVTGITTFVIGVLTTVLVYHCISKSRSKKSKREQQTAPDYEPTDKIELRENMAYGPVQKPEVRENVTYEPVGLQQ